LIQDFTDKIEVVFHHSCELGEGPVWDAESNSILWLDILNGQIHEFSSYSNAFRSLDVRQMIGCIGITSDGNLIAGLKNGIGLINRTTAQVEMIAQPEQHMPGNRFNDGKCDPAGRFWAGTMAISEEPGAGNLYVVNHNRSIQKMKTGVSISNGLAWSSDGQTMYYIDSPTHKVFAFDFDLNNGNISNERIIIQIPETDGSPDGMTIDTEGMLWIAHWGGWQVSRWDPQSGKKIMQIAMPVEKVTSCSFGGSHLNDLYITSARVGLLDDELKMQPLAGSLFVVKNCGYQGIPASKFLV